MINKNILCEEEVNISGEYFVDLDELVLRCRDEQARQYIAEAVACYRAGAFRACIVMTWTAVIFDFLHKLRELELSGDANAAQQLQQFENIQTNHDIRRSLEFERQMLRRARDDFELISHTEYTDLERLRDDRNRCAHPSLQVSGDPYQPTAELARYHLRNAVTHFLQQPPVQGKAAQTLIWNDIESAFFPTDLNLVIGIFKQGLLAQARQSLIRAMVVGLTKNLLQQELTAKECLQRFSALNAILEMYVAIGERVLFEDLPRIISRLDDSHWPNVLTYLRNVPRAWAAMGEPGRIKAETFVATVPSDQAAPIIRDALNIPSLKAIAHMRTYDLSEEALAEQIKVEPLPEYADAVIQLFSTAPSFRSSDFSSRSLLLPLVPVLSVDQINTVIHAYMDNNQLYWNHNVVDVMGKIFLETENYADATKDAWIEAYHRGEVREYMDKDFLTLIEERYPEVLNEKVNS